MTDAAAKSETAPVGQKLDLLLDVPLQIAVELGRSRLTIQELLGLGPGAVIELDKLAGEPLDILVNDRLRGRRRRDDDLT